MILIGIMTATTHNSPPFYDTAIKNVKAIRWEIFSHRPRIRGSRSRNMV